MPTPIVANQNLMTWAAFTQAGYEALVNACCNIGTYKEGIPAKLKSGYTGGNVCGYTGIGIAHSKSTFSVNWAASPSNLIPLVASGTVSTEWNTFLTDAKIDIRSNKIIQAQEASHKNEWAVQEFLAQLKAWWANNKVSELRLILKAEWASSLEALQQAVQWLELPKNVTIKVIHADVWQFSESDVSLGQVSKALLIWFNVSINAILKKKAEQQKVEIKSFDIIYELTDYLLNLLQWMVEVEKQEVTVGKLDVLGIFFTQSKEMTIGWMVIEWRVKNKLRFRVHRWEDIICNWEILSLQRNKDQVKEVIEWEDCGMKVKTGKKIQEHDILEFYELQDVVEKPEEKKAE